jgi:hypothetical protein
MATQYIKFKRSAIPGKRPSNSQMELGELALNTNDGRLFTKKENVGIGTTVTLLNVWTENVGGGAYYTDGNIGIGITNPTAKLQVFGAISAGNATSGTFESGYFLLRPNDSQYRSFAVVEDDTNLRIGGGAWNAVNIRTAPNNEVRVAITSSGNVGIGTTNPTSRLHISGDSLVTGVVTATAFNGNINAGIGTITNLSGTNVSYSGIGTVGSLNIGSTQVISSARQLQNIASLDATTTATIETAIANAPNTFTDLQVTGVSTFTNGPVLIGSGTSTGVSEQRLQVTGGAYISDNTGIGTTNPTSKLTVQGDVSIASTVSIGSSIDIIPYDNLGTLSFEGSAGQLFSITNNLTSGSIFSVNDVSGIPSIDVDADGTVQIATYGGNLGVGTTNPTSKLTVQGDVLVSGVITSTDYNSASDINLKENIQPIENPIDKVLNITGVSFDWKEDGRSSMGVIAQEVERVLPELVSGSDTKTVNYNGLIGLLIEVVKDQQKEINMLKESMKRL